MRNVFPGSGRPVFALALAIFAGRDCRAQDPFAGLESLFAQPKMYDCRYTAAAPAIDGDLGDGVWKTAPWTENFEDIEGPAKPKPAWNTRVRMLWDRTNLYIAAELQEPHVWGTLRRHDEIIYHDNDFEIFLDPDNNTHNYFEIEVNALNTVLDLFLPKPYRDGGAVLMSWDAPGLRSAVRVNGTLNRAADTDRSWTVEMSIPFSALSMGNHPRVPSEGDFWRVNFSRVQWETEIIGGNYVRKKDAQGKTLPENNWVWSPQGVINMHFPERWGYVRFVKEAAETAFELPEAEKLRKYLWLVYYRQKEFQRKNGRFARDLQELGIKPDAEAAGVPGHVEMESASRQFSAVIKWGTNHFVSINQEGLIQQR